MYFVEQGGGFVEREKQKAYWGGSHLVDEQSGRGAVGEETNVGCTGCHDGCVCVGGGYKGEKWAKKVSILVVLQR